MAREPRQLVAGVYLDLLRKPAGCCSTSKIFV